MSSSGCSLMKSATRFSAVRSEVYTPSMRMKQPGTLTGSTCDMAHGLALAEISPYARVGGKRLRAALPRVPVEFGRPQIGGGAARIPLRSLAQIVGDLLLEGRTRRVIRRERDARSSA